MWPPGQRDFAVFERTATARLPSFALPAGFRAARLRLSAIRIMPVSVGQAKASAICAAQS